MNLNPTPEQAAFTDELRGWLESNITWEYGNTPPRPADLAQRVADGQHWQSILADGRYVAVSWPEEYGGRGLGPVEHFIVQQELSRAGAPEMVGRIGLNLVGPTLLAHGTPDQRSRWLGPILRGDQLWCQLFSEPDAGSDLASLRTAATRVDGGWVLNGQKVWNSYAQFADWAICLARTDPEASKQAGLSFFIVNMSDPGVECRPLVQITGESEFNQVFLSDVVVPDDQLIGDVNAGWRIAGTTLGYERGLNPRQQVTLTQLLENLWRLADDSGALGRSRNGAPADPSIHRDPHFPAPQPSDPVTLSHRRRARPAGQRRQALVERDVPALSRARARRPRRRRAPLGGSRRQPR